MGMFELPQELFAFAMLRREALRYRDRDERGASAIEWAIISAIVVAAALGIGLVIASVINKKHGEIQPRGNG